MAQMIGTPPFHGFIFEGERYDCGDRAGYLQASLAIALAGEDIGDAIRRFVKALLASAA